MKYAWWRGFKAGPDLHANSPAGNLNCLNPIQSNSEKKNRTLKTAETFPRQPSGAHKSILKMSFRLQRGTRGGSQSILSSKCEKVQPSFKLEEGRKRTYCLEMLFGSVIIQNQPQPSHVFVGIACSSIFKSSFFGTKVRKVAITYRKLVSPWMPSAWLSNQTLQQIPSR